MSRRASEEHVLRVVGGWRDELGCGGCGGGGGDGGGAG